MLVIRMQRVGRKGLPQYRIVVQDSQRTPTSGKVVKLLGRHNPHTKDTVLDNELASHYLKNGAQPSLRVAKLFKDNGVKLPDWFSFPSDSSKSTKNPEKLRKNSPVEEVIEESPADKEVDVSEGKAEEGIQVDASEASENEAEPEK
jgi:small subunit ribosomal protein S16